MPFRFDCRRMLLLLYTCMCWVFWDRLAECQPPLLSLQIYALQYCWCWQKVWTCLTMQQSMKPSWVRGGSLSQVPNWEVISEFQLSVKIMSSKLTNMEMIHPDRKFQFFMSHFHHIFSGNLVYMPSIWCERYPWHLFCNKLGQVMDLVLFLLYLLCWPCTWL